MTGRILTRDDYRLQIMPGRVKLGRLFFLAALGLFVVALMGVGQ